MTTACPCGTGRAFASCCQPLHRQQRVAATAEELMRSRYSAYSVGDDDHVFRTWHPRTRPDDVSTSPVLRWEGLEIVRTEAGGAEDETGQVEFRARWSMPGDRGEMHELSRFERRASRWFYVQGEMLG